MSYFYLTRESFNQKVGPIPVSTSSADTCPQDCPLKGRGCYAQEGPLRFHWAKVSSGERGYGWGRFCAEVALLPEGQIWRHNQAGDLPGYTGDHIDREMVQDLIAANHGRRGFTYTHRYRNNYDLGTIELCNANGFTVNISVESQELADWYITRAPISLTVASWEARKQFETPGGNLVRLCPAVYKPGVTCETCGRCQQADRPYIIGIPAHGSGYIKVNEACGYVPRLF